MCFPEGFTQPNSAHSTVDILIEVTLLNIVFTPIVSPHQDKVDVLFSASTVTHFEQKQLSAVEPACL